MEGRGTYIKSLVYSSTEKVVTTWVKTSVMESFVRRGVLRLLVRNWTYPLDGRISRDLAYSETLKIDLLPLREKSDESSRVEGGRGLVMRSK